MADAKSDTDGMDNISATDTTTESVADQSSNHLMDENHSPIEEYDDLNNQPVDDVYDDHDERHTSMSSRILTWLVLLIAGAGAALWGGPKLAPQLPEWAAPAAKFLTPGGDAAIREVSDLRTEVTDRLAQAPSADELAAMVQTEATTLVETEVSGLQTQLEQRLSELEAQVAAPDTTNFDARLSTIETQVEGMSAELASLSTSINDSLSQGGTISEEALADITSKSAEIDGLRAQVGDISGQLGTLTQRVVDAEAQAQTRVEEATAAAAMAEEKAAEIAANTARKETLEALSEVAHTGAPFAAELQAFADATDAELPASIAGSAETGVRSVASLRSEFAVLSHEAIRVSITADAQEEGNAAAKFGAFLKSQVASRSLTAQEGDSTDAILSRINAALDADDLGKITSEAANLSDAAKAPLASWLTAVEARKAVLDDLAALAAQPS